ncbi:hypothetical protein Fleli_3168 [Bernardetia litoralis DSM 6794]|uniref:Uncharacterized protein n=2 Tax=Bernardetia litoralis TaxID=999 RepID=I4ANG7_BERLS|nr:hypothetical protein Fleli_3168 [Bernardetia litoralis DSM 6794]
MFLFISCTENINKIGCGEITNIGFDSQDSLWLPIKKDSLLYSNENGAVLFNLYDYQSITINKSKCNNPIHFSADYGTLNKQLFYSISINKSDEKSAINYSFSKMSDNLIPIIAQAMGIIDIETNQPINTESVDFVQTTKLGTHELNGKTYNDVFVIEDLKESEVPEIDISRFYVNPSGILRIEFYDGEIWDRVD